MCARSRARARPGCGSVLASTISFWAGLMERMNRISRLYDVNTFAHCNRYNRLVEGYVSYDVLRKLLPNDHAMEAG